MKSKKRKFWGWGYEDYPIDQGRVDGYTKMLLRSLDIEELSNIQAPRLEDLFLRAPRFQLTRDIQDICSADVYDRASHSYGKSYRDIWRGLHGQFENPPDYVAYPRLEKDIELLYQFAEERNISIVPYGGGSSVVGGIEPTKDTSYTGVITVDMKYFNQILKVDKKSRCALVQSGIYGLELEKGLKPHGLTLRHYPQSLEFSTLGGWIATRSGGHFATLYTHIDEFVQSVRMVTPTGVMQTRRLPGSGAGPSEERLISGSEGILGIITEAWVRLQQIPIYKKTQTVQFKKWEDGVEACRLIAQSGLYPTNARLVDPMEAFFNGLGDGSHTVLILGFESHNHLVDHWMEEALRLATLQNGTYTIRKTSTKTDKSASSWKKSFFDAPYLRDELMKKGFILETFETAVIWDQFDHFHRGILSAINDAIKEICGAGLVTCRFTHLYPDGPAPYYTITAKGQTGREIEQWDQIKKAASQAIIDLGGTITHHHAVGKDHRPYYHQQKSPIFDRSLRAIKKELDPEWILNPEVLIDQDH